MKIDACLLFNELDLLELRLTELAGVVDRFVVVEATRTHKGTLKPLYYAENKARFAEWEDKIVHIVCPLADDGDGLPAIRRREMIQRNAIIQGIRDCADNDILLISDCDELPRSELIPSHIEDGVIATYLQKLYYFDFNTYAPDRVWPGTRVCRVADARALSPHVIRNGLGQPDRIYPQYMHIENGGWHYSYFGGAAAIQHKMTEFLHQELVTSANTTQAAIEQKVSEARDIWGRDGEQTFTIGPADDLPYAVLRDLPKWSHHFRADWAPEFHEDWYNGGQAIYMAALARQAPEGAIVEIGAWEGRSTVVLAQLIAPRTVVVVDHWKGNIDEDAEHESGHTARERDVQAAFWHNVRVLTEKNVTPICMGWQDWARVWDAPIAFLHLDASHDRASVRDCLTAITPFLVNGAILCGDDAYDERVIAGVRDVFPDAEIIGKRLWKVVYANPYR